MAVIDRTQLTNAVSPPLSGVLLTALIDAYQEQENRYLVSDFGPATLNGGHFCEAASRIVYHIDSANLSLTKSVDDCWKYVEDNSLAHAYPSRDSVLQIGRVVRSIYKVRSKRGAIHLSPDYTANHLDSRLILDNSRWILGEILRVFWSADPGGLADTVLNLVEFEIPAIVEYDGVPLVLNTGLTAYNEVALLLYWFGNAGASRTAIGQAVRASASSVTKALARMTGTAERRAILMADDSYRLTPLGIKFVMEAKLLAP